jgi:hypothetical protein
VSHFAKAISRLVQCLEGLAGLALQSGHHRRVAMLGMPWERARAMIFRIVASADPLSIRASVKRSASSSPRNSMAMLYLIAIRTDRTEHPSNSEATSLGVAARSVGPPQPVQDDFRVAIARHSNALVDRSAVARFSYRRGNPYATPNRISVRCRTQPGVG